MYYPRFTKVINHHFLNKDKAISKRNKIGMHTSRDDYLINTLRFVSAKEESQIYGARLPKSMTSPEMRETKAYKTYLFYATGVTPPKKARKFKKPASPKLSTIPASLEEPTRKSKRVKRPAKKSSDAPTACVIIRENHVKSLPKKKEKMTVEKRKGIDLLSEVALTEEAQYEEVHKKSLRDFHKTRPSGSGTVTKIAPSAAKIKPSITNEGTGVKPRDPDVTEEESTESEAESWGKDEDDINNEHDSKSEGSDQERDSRDDNTQSDSKKGSDSKHETGSESDQEENEEDVEDDEEEKDDKLVKTPSKSTDDEDETKIKDKAKGEGDEDEGMDYTTNQFDDDVDLRMNEPVTTDEGFIQKEDAEIVSPMDVHVHHEVLSKQTPTLLTVPISVITESSPIFTTIIPQSLPSFTPPPVTTLEKEVADLKRNDPLNTQVTALVDEHLDSRLEATRDEFMSYLSASITVRITEQVKKSLDHAVLAKESSQLKSTYKAVATLIEFELKKILINKIDEMYSLKRSQKDNDKDEDPSDGSGRGLKKRKTSKDAGPTKGSKAKESQFGSSKGAKSQSTSSRKSIHTEEPEFKVADSDMPHDPEEKLGNVDEEPKGKVSSKHDWFTTPKRPQEPTDPNWNVVKTPPRTYLKLITNLTQETLLWPAFKLLKGTRSNYAELEYDFKECYKALSEKLDWDNPEGSDYPFDLTKPLPLVMNGNRQIVPVNYFFNNNLKYLQGGISTMTYMTSITKTKAAQYDLPGIEDMVPNIWSPIKVAYDKHALWGISHWRDQRKSFYGYARGLESTHDVYSTKRDFPRLRINDIEDMLLLVVQNRLTNLLGNDVSYFSIALRMFTRSMVIQKRVEDLQLGVKSYQKNINVTKPETTKLGIRKRDPYTPYQDPQGFIYVDNKRRNMLMRSDELYKKEALLTLRQKPGQYICCQNHKDDY
ncbi:hypothetical protein Tco_0747838 [Tanacetum coccineum]|uniref:Uncharacterized protein n=1 Tax=Tanacetum coccineum TaxID=301880 RepID=A0ABQ4YWS3_9ASTR